MEHDKEQHNAHHQGHNTHNPLSASPHETPQFAFTPPPGHEAPDAPQPQAAPTPPVPPAPAPAAPAPAGPAGAASHANPTLIVLQWLTYAFWGWTVLATSLLTISVLANFISDADDSTFIPYAIAAVLVLLPLSLVCDIFYSKHEPERKTGAASLVMVLHAVLFALFGIGTVIAIVVSLVQLLTSNSDTANVQVALYSEVIIAALYAAVFLRTLHPPGLAWFRRFFPILMVIAVGIISIIGIIGPVAHARLTRNDRLIDDNLPAIQSSVSDYVNNHSKLPETLGSITIYSSDARKLANSGSVQYIPNSKAPTVLPSTSDSYSTTTFNLGQQASLPKTYYYQFCVNYKKASVDHNDYSSPSSANNDYSEYISTENHPAGKVCYDAKSTADY
jgi:hypothetical protein